MEDLTDLRTVLPEASGTAGFFWNGLSFDCFPIVCSQTRRLKKAAETGRPQINIYLPNVRRYEKAIWVASPAAQLLSAGSGCHNGL